MKIPNFLPTSGGTKRDFASPHASLWILFFSFGIAFEFFPGHTIAEAEVNVANFATVAADIDLRLQEAVDRMPTPSDDATFFSRVWIDLAGRRPDATDIKQFLGNRNPEKRNALVKQLLNNSRFGRHWGHYWRDTILARRADERALQLVSDSLTDAVAQRINNNVRWDQIATDFITASGDVRKHGVTGLFLAQKGEPEGITAEVARIFLGIQIQCAQCHDHPTDQWKREQFHQLAAFFPRVGVRRTRDGKPRSFEVYSRNKQGGGKKSKNKKPLEYYMPDLAQPDSRGQITKPIFFLTGHSLELGSTDKTRREALANWLTDAETNPWFARAYVNRIWTELMGHGFYASVDDIGPERDCTHPAILSLLAEHFVARGYDTKWLFQTIMATAAYQSSSPLPGETTEANPSRPLRSDVIFDNLVQALEVTRSAKDQSNQKQRGKARQVFQQAFFYDPSLPRDEINPTIPQALLLMNSRQIYQFIRSDRPNTMLGRLLVEQSDNEDVVETLYLRCLGRFPTDQEWRTCLKHLQEEKNRNVACEDILWSLLNTAEFRQRN